MMQGKRAVKKAQVRQQLLAHARRLFSEKGMENTTVADIVDACGIARGTYYNYFADVKGVFEEVLDDINLQVRAATAAARREATSFYDLYYRTFKAYFDVVSGKDLVEFHKKNQIQIRSISYNNKILLKELKDIQSDVQRIKTRGHFKTDQELELLSYMIVGAPTELFLNVMTSDAALTNHEVATFLAKLFTKGAGLTLT